MATVSEAFLKLVEIASRSRESASDLPSKTEVETHWSGIGFTLGGVRYVAPMGEVAEILRVPRYTQVPGVRTWVKGVSNVRGRLLPIMDLMSFFDKASAFQVRQRRLLVIDKGDLYSGLVVDEVLGMQHFPMASFDDNPQDIEHEIAPFLQGSYHRERDGRWLVFSLHKLSDDPRFMHVAS